MSGRETGGNHKAKGKGANPFPQGEYEPAFALIVSSANGRGKVRAICVTGRESLIRVIIWGSKCFLKGDGGGVCVLLHGLPVCLSEEQDHQGAGSHPLLWSFS